MDYAHKKTDAELAKLEKKISKLYSEASQELGKTIDEYFAKFKQRDLDMKKLVDAGEMSESDYRQWRLTQIGRGERFKALQNTLAERLADTRETALQYVNDVTPGVYALNRNFANYAIDQQVGGVGFNLFDEATVRRLFVDNPRTMPNYPRERALQRGIDLAYSKKRINAATTSGILQGKSVEKIATELQQSVFGENRAAAIRAARTAMTSAQNGGRQDSYDAAKEMGIELEKEWIATLDDRTRHEHQDADGQIVPQDGDFIVDGVKMRFPGDSEAPGYLVYNCRCTVASRVKGVPHGEPRQTYSEWAKSKEYADWHSSDEYKSWLTEHKREEWGTMYRRWERNKK